MKNQILMHGYISLGDTYSILTRHVFRISKYIILIKKYVIKSGNRMQVILQGCKEMLQRQYQVSPKVIYLSIKI